MALTYNNVDPTTINYKGTDVTIVKYGNTNVWGKHYNLSINAGSNTSVVVNRTSSPNQHASTGNLSNGATIYYGDTLTITYSVSTGYNINTHTVNGITFTSGTSYSVSGNISVVTTAVSAASWHTVWTGSKFLGVNGSTGTSNLTGFSGIKTSVSRTNTRITGYFYHVYDEEGWDTPRIDISEWYLDKAVIAQYPSSVTYGSKPNNTSSLYAYVNSFTSSALNISYCGYTSWYGHYDRLYITKIEQYY